MAKIQVLYEDNHLIAVVKPPGYVVQGKQPGEVSFTDLVKEFLKVKYQKPGEVFLGILHRLDRPVEGVVLFAKTSKGAARLSEQIRLGKFRKTYLALVEGMVAPEKGELRSFIKHEHGQSKAETSARSKENFKEAVLGYEVLEKRGAETLLRVELKTGRYHQIRAQLSELGYPIVGDRLYGSKKDFTNGGIALCSHRISFFGPVSKDKLDVTYKPDWAS